MFVGKWERRRERNCLSDGLLFRKKLVYEVDGGKHLRILLPAEDVDLHFMKIELLKLLLLLPKRETVVLSYSSERNGRGKEIIPKKKLINLK